MSAYPVLHLGGALEVGRSSTKAVVYAVVIVMIANLLTQMLLNEPLAMIKSTTCRSRLGTKCLKNVRAVPRESQLHHWRSGSGKSVMTKCTVGS